eukprot:NODE_521_length_6537_cov_0.627058.p1 type:complete len:667 gc:universal NODE_521_length_6537_cov_0.627058:4937-2937(-)
MSTSKVAMIEESVMYAVKSAMFYKGSDKRNSLIYFDSDGSSGTAYYVVDVEGKLKKNILISTSRLSLYSHETHKNTLYALTATQLLKYDGNLLEKISFSLPTEAEGNRLILHPFLTEWLLLESPLDRFGQHKNYYYTTDSGKSWMKVLDKKILKKCIWAHGVSLVKTPRSAILCQDNSNSMLASDDFFESTTTFEDNIQVFAVYGNFIVGGVLLNNNIVVDISDNGLNWHRANFSPPYPRAKSITATDSAGGRLFIDVALDDNTGSLYISDGQGKDFTKQLENTYRYNGNVDTSALESLPAIHFINVHDLKDNHKIKTLISYDNGGTWHPIKAPKSECDCDLHFQGYTKASDSRHFMDSTNTPGVIMAKGRGGENLDPRSDEVKVFISTDAGMSWKKVSDENLDFEFLNYGNIIVLFDSRKETDNFQYTSNYFKSLQVQKFNDNARYKISIGLSDKKSSGLRMFFSAKSEDQEKVIIADFESLLHIKCTNEDLESQEIVVKGSDGSDIECFFGAKVLVKRKKADSNCYFDETISDIVTKIPCKCTIHDFECNAEAFRENNICIPNRKSEFPCINDKITKPSGYRKNPGNLCTGGLSLDQPIISPCSTLTTGAVIAIAVIPTVIGIIAFFVMLHMRRHGELPFGLSDRFRHIRYQNVDSNDNRLFDD